MILRHRQEQIYYRVGIMLLIGNSEGLISDVDDWFQSYNPELGCRATDLWNDEAGLDRLEKYIDSFCRQEQ